MDALELIQVQAEGVGEHGLDDVAVRYGQPHRVRAVGVNIAIDDFGTGFSSLSRLADLPTHQLKIDRAFVMGLGETPESLEIVRTIVALARALNLEVIAEGVETPRQARILLGEGVHIAQGYLFSRPVSAQMCLQMWHTGIAMPQVLTR